MTKQNKPKKSTKKKAKSEQTESSVEVSVAPSVAEAAQPNSLLPKIILKPIEELRRRVDVLEKLVEKLSSSLGGNS